MYIDPSGEFGLLLGLVIFGAIAGALIGGALGLSTALGIQYLAPYLLGSTTVSTSTVLASFGTSTGVAFGAGSVGYVFNQAFNKKEIILKNVIGNGLIIGIESIFSYGVGGLIGSIGNYENFSPMFTKEFLLKKALFAEFTKPSQYLFEKLRYIIFD